MAVRPDVRLPGWRSQAGRAAYVAAYRAAEALWPVPIEDVELPTRFGPTHSVVCGPHDAPPLFLLHAAFGTGAMQWFPNAAALSRLHRVVALDFVGAPGLGAQIAPILDRTDCADWLIDVLDAQGVDQADLVGSSHGGWLSLNLAVQHPDRVRRLALLAPAASLLPFRPPAVVSLRLGPFMRSWAAAPSVRALFGGRCQAEPRITELLAASLDHYRYQQRAVFPDVFSDAELQSVTATTLVALGEREVIYDPVKALRRAQSVIPTVHTVWVADTGHLINMECPQLADGLLLELLAP